MLSGLLLHLVLTVCVTVKDTAVQRTQVAGPELVTT